jgi:hypothetical protein
MLVPMGFQNPNYKTPTITTWTHYELNVKCGLPIINLISPQKNNQFDI